MNTTVGDMVSAFCDALEVGDRLDAFVRRADEEGHPQLAKMFRAAILSERFRVERFRVGILGHVEGEEDFYVCPFCGLIYEQEAPEKCLVDDTKQEAFTKVN